MAYSKIKPLPYIPFYILLLPSLIMGGHVVQSTYSTNFYYGPFAGNFLSIAFDPVSIALYALAAFVVTKLLHYARTFRKKSWKIISYIVLTLMLIMSAFFMLMALMFMPMRYHVSNEYCRSPLIADLQRCEGLTKTFMQDRNSAVARYGNAVPDVQNSLTSYPDYNLYQLPCAELQYGDLGEACYMGQDQRETGDVDFMALYIKGQKILILETENITPLISPTAETSRLTEFVDLERFRDDMAEGK